MEKSFPQNQQKFSTGYSLVIPLFIGVSTFPQCIIIIYIIIYIILVIIGMWKIENTIQKNILIIKIKVTN